MSLKIGQREVTAWVFLLISGLAVALGKTPEETLPLLLEVMAPLALVLATFVNFTNVIHIRVTNGTLKAGSIRELFKTRETYYALAILLAGAVSIAGKRLFGIDINNETKSLIINVIWNGGMVLGNVLLSSFNLRLPTIQVDNQTLAQAQAQVLRQAAIAHAMASVPSYRDLKPESPKPFVDEASVLDR